MPGVPPPRFAYLGPAGTFTEAALRSLPAAARGDLTPCASVPAALDAVRTGSADFAMVPIENSVEGSVATTLDELASGDPLQVVREVLLPVRFALLARAGTAIGDVETVATHPHAAAQCRRWLQVHLPRAEVVPASSTADAARAVAEGRFAAAVAAPVAGERYGLVALADDVQDSDGAVTRFVLVSRPGPLPPPTGADRTGVFAFIADDHPGALLALLTEFAVRGVNLSRIESRPTGGRLGQYFFSLDCDGHLADERVGEALSALHRVCAEVRVVGSWARGDGTSVPVTPATSDADFRDAAAWLARLRAGG